MAYFAPWVRPTINRKIGLMPDRKIKDAIAVMALEAVVSDGPAKVEQLFPGALEYGIKRRLFAQDEVRRSIEQYEFTASLDRNLARIYRKELQDQRLDENYRKTVENALETIGKRQIK